MDELIYVLVLQNARVQMLLRHMAATAVESGKYFKLSK